MAKRRGSRRRRRRPKKETMPWEEWGEPLTKESRDYAAAVAGRTRAEEAAGDAMGGDWREGEKVPANPDLAKLKRKLMR